MEIVFIILVIGFIALGVIKFKKKKVADKPVTRRSFTGGGDLPKDKVDHIEDENLKLE